jgi:6-phosphogluconolactonase
MKIKVWIHKNSEDLTNAAASQIARILIQAVRLHGNAYMLLSGGSTPVDVYKALAQNQYRISVPWNSVHFFWGDERCVPPEDPESNYRQAFDNLLRNIPFNPKKIHRIKGEYSPQDAVSEYIDVLSYHAQENKPWPIFDVALMGMGEDGHTASLFPGMFNPGEDVNPVVHVTATYQNRPSNRVTLTPLVFNSSRNVIFLVAGDAKAVSLQKALSDKDDLKNLPVQRIRPATGNVFWHVDSAAAKFLHERS